MFGMGMGELLLILVVALIVLGPDKIPEAAKAIGKGMRELRRHSRDLKSTIEQDEELAGTVKEIKAALTGDEAPPSIRPPAVPPPHAVAARPTAPPAASGLGTSASAATSAPAPVAAERSPDPGRRDG